MPYLVGREEPPPPPDAELLEGLRDDTTRQITCEAMRQPRCVLHGLPVKPRPSESSAKGTAEVLLVRELLAGVGLEEVSVARRLFGDLTYRGYFFLGQTAVRC